MISLTNLKQALKTSPFLLITFAVLIGFVTVLPGVALAATEREHLAAKLTLADAKHLLTRTGFGAHPTKLAELAGLSREQAISDIIAGLNTTTQHPLPQWVEAPAPLYTIKADMPIEWRREFGKARNRELSNLRQWWVYEMIATTSPQTERLVLFWHNHFVSSYSAINQQSTSIARQNRMFRRLGSDNYRTFLKNVIRDPAMLNYLDNTSNRKGAPNENLARELLELFTLGEGHYTEQDIKNAARSLTGFTVSPSSNMQFRFHPWQHDFKNKELFGQQGPFDADDLVNIILQQPRAALFVTEKFWAEYISRDFIDRSELQRIAKTFRQSDYDIKTLYRELISSVAFWDQANRATLIKSPVDLVIGTLRSTGKVPRSWQSLPVVLASLGQNLFEPPNVAGWPGHDTWVTPERLLARLDWFERFDQSRVAKRADAMIASDSDTTDLSVNSMSMMSGSPAQSQVVPVDSLSMMQATKVAASTGNPRLNTLTAAGVHLQWVRNPEAKKRDHADLAFTLSNVTFEDRQWSTMMLRLVRGKGKRLEMRLESYACWPDCVEQWPECSWTSEHDAGHREIVLDLPVTENLCHFESLSAKDKRLVSALWQLMPQIYKAVAQSKKLERSKARKFYQAWGKYVNRKESQLAASHYMTQTRFELEIDGDYKDDFVIAKNFFDSPPLPNSRSFSDYASDVEHLQERYSGLDLQLLLMPGDVDLSSGFSGSFKPANSITPVGRGELASILANPVFQLK